MIGRIGAISHHLQSLLGVIELTVYVHLYARYFGAQIKKTILYK